MAQTLGFDIMVMLSREFDEIEVLENWGEYFKLGLQKEDKSIAWFFRELARKKKLLGIEYYSVTQTTLEQIFQKFASNNIGRKKSAITYTYDGDSIRLLNSEQGIAENNDADDEENSESLLLQDF